MVCRSAFSTCLVQQAIRVDLREAYPHVLDKVIQFVHLLGESAQKIESEAGILFSVSVHDIRLKDVTPCAIIG
jgi:hypothetical protein